MPAPQHLPPPRTADPRSGPTLRWGIMGPGWIAQRFTATLQKHTTQRVVAVGSRSQPRADEFAATWSVPAAYGSYQELLADPDVEVVYVATPHTEHHACALAALAAGKHVLVEKPMGVNAAQAAEIAESARGAGLFAGEAMWMKFLPKFDVIRQIIDDGMLGTIHTVIADHGEHFTTDHRIYDPTLAGGPMLDLGSYPVALAHFTFGAPESVLASGQLANPQLNGQISAILTHAGGSQASLHTTILSDTPCAAVIAGDEATLVIPGVFYAARSVHRVLPRRNLASLRRGAQSRWIRAALLRGGSRTDHRRRRYRVRTASVIGGHRNARDDGRDPPTTGHRLSRRADSLADAPDQRMNGDC